MKGKEFKKLIDNIEDIQKYPIELCWSPLYQKQDYGFAILEDCSFNIAKWLVYADLDISAYKGNLTFTNVAATYVSVKDEELTDMQLIILTQIIEHNIKVK